MRSDAARIRKPVLPYIETHLSDRCNLNCKACSHFSSLFSNNDEISLESFTRDIAKISENVFLEKLNLLGGEPLLAPRLTDFLKTSRRLLPKTSISLTTNGLLLPTLPDDVLDCLRECDIRVAITPYPPTMERLSEIEEKLTRHGVGYDIKYAYHPDGRVAYDYFMRLLDPSGKNDPWTARNRCYNGICNFLRNGRLYVCPIEALLYKYQEHFPEGPFHFDTSAFGIDIHDEKLEWDKVALTLFGLSPVCRFCSDKGMEPIVWRPSPHPAADEWFVGGS